MLIDIPNFTENELMCPCCIAPQDLTTYPPWDNINRLAVHLQVLRNLCGYPLKINSAYRCEHHNKAVGGSKRSQHLKGLAADISTKRWSEKKKDNLIKLASVLGFKGIGRYDTFIHIDLRNRITHWDERTK